MNETVFLSWAASSDVLLSLSKAAAAEYKQTFIVGRSRCFTLDLYSFAQGSLVAVPFSTRCIMLEMKARPLTE